MSTQVPVDTPAIPHPTTDTTSLQFAVLSIKQNIELAQGTRGTAFAARLHGPTPVDIAMAAALRKVS